MSAVDVTIAVRPEMGWQPEVGALLYDGRGRIVGWVQRLAPQPHRVIITQRGDKAISLIKEIRAVTGLGLGDAKAILDRAASGESEVAVFDTRAQAEAAAHQIESGSDSKVRVEVAR